jgi:hypothetical protein
MRGKFEYVEGGTGITVGKDSYLLQRVLVDDYGELSQATLFIFEGTFQDGQYLFFAEAVEGEDAAAGEKGGVDLEAGVFGRGSYEGDDAALDMGQDGILLGFVEAVDFVDEQDGALFGELAQFASIFHYFAQVGDARGDGAERDEVSMGLAGNYFGEGGFSAAGWSPEDDGGNTVLFDAAAQGASRCQEMSLADDLVECARAYTRGQRFH